jgi:AraC family transcriptional activator of pobA
MEPIGTHTIINEQNGNLAFKIISFIDNSHFDYFQRNNFHTLVLIDTGEGELVTNFGNFAIDKNSVVAFSPYEPFMIKGRHCQGIAVQFHSDFFCINKHQSEVTCDGILFNNVHQVPVFKIDDSTKRLFEDTFLKISNEINNATYGHFEMLISYLKIVLITASRIKATLVPDSVSKSKTDSDLLQNLKRLIESNFKTQHFADFYADKLSTTPKSLGSILKKHYSRNFSQMISERVLIEAKRELYLTNKSAKEIAYELGFNDEHYFSRFFKKNCSITTQEYRETVGFGRDEICDGIMV